MIYPVHIQFMSICYIQWHIFRQNFQVMRNIYMTEKVWCLARPAVCLCSIPTCTPLRQVFAIRREFQYPGIAVAIRHKDVPCASVHSHISGLAEVGNVTSWCKSLSQCQQGSISSVTADFQHLMRTEKRLWIAQVQTSCLQMTSNSCLQIIYKCN